MNRKVLFMVALLFMLPVNIRAFCSNEQLSRYKSLASNVNNYYEFDENSKTFNIVFYNVNNEFFIKNTNNNDVINISGSSMQSIYLSNFKPGSALTFALYPANSECSSNRVRTIYVNLPYYNSYYSDDVCLNNSNKLCSKWVNTSIYTYEQFVDKVKTKKDEIVVHTTEKEKIENHYDFFDFLADYYMVILIAIIVFGSYGIYVLDKKSKFDF